MYCWRCDFNNWVLSQFCFGEFVFLSLSIDNDPTVIFGQWNGLVSPAQGEGHVRVTSVTVILVFGGADLTFLPRLCNDMEVCQPSSLLSVIGKPWWKCVRLGSFLWYVTLCVLKDLSRLLQIILRDVVSIFPILLYTIAVICGIWMDASWFGYTVMTTDAISKNQALIPGSRVSIWISNVLFEFYLRDLFRLMLGCGVRWGEAQNPGPVYRFAITNPTSVVSKVNHYSFLKHQFDIQTFVAAETSATGVAQKIFGRKVQQLSMKACWSTPVPDQFETVSGEPSLRGKAMGVACFTSLPLRPAIATIPPEMTVFSRLCHQLLTLGKMQIQLVAIYGYPSTYRDSDVLNSRLVQTALDAIDCLPLPAIIAGDFNCDPFELSVADALRDRGFSDLKAIHKNLKRSNMPGTCRQVTHPDNALVCPVLTPRVSDVWVYQDPLFDVHCPVVFDVNIDHEHQFQSKMDLPKSWIPLAFDDEFWSEAYQDVSVSQGPPTDLQTWGGMIEHAADTVYRRTQVKHLDVPWDSTRGLSSAYRGRCQPRKIQKQLIRSIYRPGRPGDFEPMQEVHSFATMKLVTQLRRIRSLKGRIRKFDSRLPSADNALQKEWEAILRGQAFPGGFVHWCIQCPELGPPPTSVPSIDYVNDLDQILTHYVNHRLALEASQWKDKQEFARRTDRRFHGSAKAFRIIKDAPATYVDELVVPIDEAGIVASDLHDPQVEIFVDRSSEFAFEDPILVNNTPCRLLSKHADSIIVKPSVELTLDSDEVQVCQQQIVVDKSRIFDLLSSFWLPFWQNESVVEPTHQHSFETFLANVPGDLPPLVVDLTDSQLWFDAIRCLKSRSTRGVDAVSAAEMQSLPRAAICDLQHLVTTYYRDGFPDWFMIARTFPLSKVPHTPQAGQIRPISVMAQIYRVWAAVCCKQLLAQLARSMPSEIQGLLRHRGPQDASYSQQFRQELCHHNREANGGISIDLVKCFNTMCRRCGSLVMRALRVPENIVVQWERSIALLSRVWIISSECSQPIRSTNGYPEGDTWSVVVMVLLAYIWVLSLKARAAQSCITAYADNWGWSTSLAPSHSVLLETTVLFVAATNMQIDWDKSWIWSTDASHAASLKRAIGRHIDSQRVAHVCSSMDLGSQLTYRGPPRLGKFRQRLHHAHGRLDRIQRLPNPLDEKIRLVLAGVYPCAFYGLQLLPVGTQHFARLRVAVANCLLGLSRSRNSAIALACLPGIDDPALAAIILAVKAARRFVLAASEEIKWQFFEMASLSNGAPQTCRGPASCLKYYLSQIGWAIGRDGSILTSNANTFSLIDSSLQDLIQAARLAWTHDLLQMHTDRVALRGLPAICRCSTRQVLGKFSPTEQSLLLKEISGSFQTRCQQASWDSSVDGNCLMCGQPDTREHRIFECPVFSDLHTRYHHVLQHFLDIGAFVHELPVIHVNPALEFVRILQSKHPEAELSADLHQKLCRLIRDLADHGTSLQFFTDGSCQFSFSPETCFGAYAVVLDTCLHDDDRIHAARIYQASGIIPGTLVPLMAARTTGNQGINRSELYALVKVVELFDRGLVYTDSATALVRIKECREAASLFALGHLPDFDLVRRLWEYPQLVNFDFTKIKAHVDPHTVPDLLLAYQCLGNQVVNDRAIQTCWHHLPELVQQYWALHLDYEVEKEFLAHYFHYLLELNQRRIELDRQLKVEHKHAEVTTPGQREDHVEIFKHWQVEQPWVMPEPRATLFSEGTWGRTLTQAVFDWATLLCWPHDGTPDRYGVTWMELTVSFLLHIGRWLPVKRNIDKELEGLVVITDDTAATSIALEFSEQIKAFCQLFGQAVDLSQQAIWPKYDRGLVRSVYVLGAKTQPAGVKSRPSFPHQAKVCQILQEYFRGLSGTAYRPLPKVIFESSLISDISLQREISGSWKSRGVRFHKAAGEIRKCRKMPQRPLVFH